MTTIEVARSTGLSEQAVERLIRDRVLTPTVSGSGNARSWSASEVLLARMVAHVRRLGIRSHHSLRNIVDAIRLSGRNPAEESFVVHVLSGGDVQVYAPDVEPVVDVSHIRILSNPITVTAELIERLREKATT